MTRACLRRLSFPRPVCVLAAATLMASAAQALPQVWGLQSSTSGQESIDGLALDGSGGTIEVGSSENVGGFIDFDMCAARRDATGTVVWKKQWGTPKFDGLLDVAADGAGAFFCVGGTEGGLFGPSHGGYDAVVMQLDLGGNLLWSEQFGTPQSDYAWAVAPDGAGGCFIAGNTEGSLAAPNQGGSKDIWVARYDAVGNRLWILQFGSLADDRAECAEPDGSGGVFVGGSRGGGVGGFWDPDHFYCRIDSSGNLLWQRQFGSDKSDSLFDILSDGAGGAYLAGQSNASPGPGLLPGGMLARADAAGNVLWMTTLGAGWGYIQEIVPDGAGGVCVGGGFSLGSAAAGQNDQAFLARFAADGSQGPMTVIGSTQDDRLRALVWDGATGWTAAGSTQGDLFGTLGGVSDAWIARFEPCDLAAFTTYCSGSVNSTGKGASIGTWGSPYLSTNDFALTVQQCPPDQLGIFILGDQSNNVPFGNGVLCVGGAVQRLLPANPTGSWGGATHLLDFTDASSPASLITAGSTWNFQFWYRDAPAGGAGFNLSNGLSATFCP